MLAYIILNGEPIEDLTLPKDCLVICADGALNFCEKHKIVPDKIVGDFDSLGSVPSGAIVYPKDKDFTDGEIALRLAKDLGACEVVFACAGGYREDHLLCNLNMLEIAHDLGLKARAVTVYSEIYFVKDEISLTVSENAFISVIAVENSVIESSFGLKFKYDHTKLPRASTLGISNVALAEKIGIKLSSGAVLLIVNKKDSDKR